MSASKKLSKTKLKTNQQQKKSKVIVLNSKLKFLFISGKQNQEFTAYKSI